MQQPSAKTRPRRRRHVACPFCGLLCDDLVIETRGDALHAIENACTRARAQFERSEPAAAPLIDGRRASLEAALDAGAALLRAADLPLIGGFATDVAGARAALALADHCGGIVDHLHGTALMRNVLTLQDHGWMTTTVAEIRNRADLIVLFGTDGETVQPRFFERCVWNKTAMFRSAAPQVVFMGRHHDPHIGISPTGTKPTVIECDKTRLTEVLSVMRALLRGAKLYADGVAGIPLETLSALVARLREARYAVLVWSPAELDFAHAELSVQAIADLIRDLNHHSRCAGFSLGGGDGAATALNVAAWQSGFPLRTSFAGGHPQYDPVAFAAEELLAREIVDAVVWISSFSSEHAPPHTRLPRIVLAHPGTRSRSKSEVFIPVGTPGLDHAGHLFRCDNIAALPLRALRKSDLPSVAGVCKGLLERLQC